MKLPKTELMELQRQASARTGRADSARHARLILLLADGFTWAQIRAKLDCSDSYIARWSQRVAAGPVGVAIVDSPETGVVGTGVAVLGTSEAMGVGEANEFATGVTRSSDTTIFSYGACSSSDGCTFGDSGGGEGKPAISIVKLARSGRGIASGTLATKKRRLATSWAASALLAHMRAPPTSISRPVASSRSLKQARQTPDRVAIK